MRRVTPNQARGRRQREAVCIDEKAAGRDGKGRDTEDGGKKKMATKKDVRLGDRRRDEAVVQSLSPGKTGPVLPAVIALPQACKPDQLGQGSLWW